MKISIRKKVLLAIGTYVVVAGVLWFLNFYNSHLINEKIRIIEKKEDLLNAVLEARRYEKNYFLTHNATHLEEAVTFIGHAQGKLRDVIVRHGAYTATHDLERNLAHLERYGEAVRALSAAGGPPGTPAVSKGSGAAPEAVRAMGREITEETERMVKIEREHINRLIRDAQFYHFTALGGLFLLSVFVLLFFFFNVNQPLRALESAIGGIASGHYENIPMVSGSLEFESLVGSLNDMLDKLNRRNQELIQAKKLASLGTLTSGVAHELNNPLNNISTSIQIVLEELEDADLEYKRDLLDGAEKEVERARDIVRALLEFSRQRAFSLKPVAFKKLVSDTLKLIRGELPANVSVEVEIPEEIVAMLDARGIQQVMLNLMLNALQAMEDGGTLTIDAFPRDTDRFCFRVGDTGGGIPAENLGKIFDPFFSTREGRRKADGDLRTYGEILEQEGTGLGLAICHGIVKKHGGEISAASEPGKGAVFTVCLPIGNPHDDLA